MTSELKHAETRHLVLEPEPAAFNVSPYAFCLWAKQYYECRLSFKYDDFSPVPYFLLCRSIELYFKALHLEEKRQKKVKDLYKHDLIKVYNDLPTENQTLSPEQFLLLRKTNDIYVGKRIRVCKYRPCASELLRLPGLKGVG